MNVLVATPRDWFASAIGGVLRAEEHTVGRAASLDELSGEVRSQRPDAVIYDVDFDGADATEVIRQLDSDLLPRETPLLAYTSGVPGERGYAELLDAGAWHVFEGRVTPDRLLAHLRRLVRLGRDRPARRETAGEAGGEGREHLPAVDALLERIPVLEAMAKREGDHLAVMAVGPTGETAGAAAERGTEELAEACLRGLRKSDLFGRLGGGDEFAIVAYSTSREGAEVLAERLAEMVARKLDVPEPERALSVGVVEVGPDDLPADVRAEDRTERQSELLGEARRALREARQAGGGVRFAS